MAFRFPFARDLIDFGSYFGHSGVDWPGSNVGSGALIPCIGPGTVVDITLNSVNDPGDHSEPTWRGNSVTVDHGTIDGIGITTLYAHMIAAPLVGLGSPVTELTMLGGVGNSGASSGTHLHVEVIYDGVRLPTSTPGNNTPGLGFQRTLAWLDAHAGTTPPDPEPTPRGGSRRPAWLNRPPTHYYRTW